MSEIGPMSSSSRLRWRMSSCANANGIAGSSAHPSAMDAPSGTKRVTASARLARLSVSAALEFRLALLDERLHALARVLALEQANERLALDPEALLERAPVALDRRELDLTDRVARACGVQERVLYGMPLKVLCRHELVDDARVLRFLRRQRRAAQHELERLLPADEPRQPLRTAGPG